MKTEAEEIFTEVWNKNVKSSDGIYTSCIEAMQLYSDQQNKELREELYSINESLTKELTIRHAEIQRLTKEVEELKLKLSGKTFFNPFEQENTRLRELLRKVQLEAIGYNESSLSEQLLTEIDNAIRQ